jgi:nucleoside-triphosphatase THEP1
VNAEPAFDTSTCAHGDRTRNVDHALVFVRSLRVTAVVAQHHLEYLDFRGPARVGHWGVDVAAIDALTETALARDRHVDIYLVGEIGKMECLSQKFVAAMRMLLDSTKPVIATIAETGMAAAVPAENSRAIKLP